MTIKLIIGIDPGAHTGVAMWDGKDWMIDTSDFLKVLDWARTIPAEKSSIQFVIETAKSLPVYSKRHKQNLAVALSVARDIGANNRESELLIQGVRRAGFQVIEYKPSKDDPKWSPSECAQITGFLGRTNEHVRDAMRFAWAYRHLLKAKV